MTNEQLKARVSVQVQGIAADIARTVAALPVEKVPHEVMELATCMPGMLMPVASQLQQQGCDQEIFETFLDCGGLR
jgi:hypothetical protein